MNSKNDFDRDLYKLMNNAVYRKTMENVRKHNIVKLVNDDTKRNKLVSEPNYHTTKWFSVNLLTIEMHIKTEDFYKDIAELLMMFKKSMIHQIILFKDHYQWV